ncbi:hypothetical protein D3C72_1624350 [compost metagenome]
MQEQHAQQHAEQRIDEVAQARIDHAVGRHRPDIEEPVGAEQGGARREAEDQARIARDLAQPAKMPPPEQDCAQEDQRPHHPVQQDLERRHAVEGFDIEGQQAPDDVREQRVEDAELHGSVR